MILSIDIFCLKGPSLYSIRLPYFSLRNRLHFESEQPKQLRYIAITVLFFWRNSSLGICTLIRLQAAATAAPFHCQTLPQHRHWLLCTSQWFLSSFTPWVSLLYPELVRCSWRLSSDLFPAMPFATTLQQSADTLGGCLYSSPCSPLDVHLKCSCITCAGPHGY